MTDQEKINFLIGAIKELKGIDVANITVESTLGSLNIDSLDAIELQMYYEDTTGTETKDPTGIVKTVGDLINLMP